MLIIGKISHYFELFIRQANNITGDLFFFLFFKIYLTIFLILNTALWVSAFYVKKILEAPMIALHYNVDFGIDYYGSVNNLFVLPSLGLVIFLLNTSLFVLVRNQQDRKFIAHILFVTANMANLILLVGLASIYLINVK